MLMKLGENSPLVGDSFVVLGGGRDLQDEVLAAVFGQERDRAGALSEAPDDSISLGEQLTGGGGGRIFDRVGIGRRGVTLHLVERFQELGDRTHPVADLGVRRPADQVLQIVRGAVDDRSDREPLVFAQLLTEFERIGRGGLPRKDQIGDRSERKEIELRFERVDRAGFRSEIDSGLFVEQVIGMSGRRDVSRTRFGAAEATTAELPVEDLQSRAIGVGGRDEDRARAERAMEDLLLVRETECFGELANEVDPLRQIERRAAAAEEVIQADRLGIVLEDDGTAEIMLVTILDAQDTGVSQVLEELELPDRGSLQRQSFFVRRPLASQVDPDATDRVGDLDMDGMPILIAGPFVDQPLQTIVADDSAAMRFAHPRFLHRLGDDAQGAGREMDARVQVVPFEVPLHQRGENARFHEGEDRIAEGIERVAPTDLDSAVPSQLKIEPLGRKEDQRLNERDLAAPLSSVLLEQ